MTSLFIALRSLTYVAGFIALWGWVALSVRIFDPMLKIALPVLTTATGTALMAPGALRWIPRRPRLMDSHGTQAI
jgi:hypothetical protein